MRKIALFISLFACAVGLCAIGGYNLELGEYLSRSKLQYFQEGLDFDYEYIGSDYSYKLDDADNILIYVGVDDSNKRNGWYTLFPLVLLAFLTSSFSNLTNFEISFTIRIE